MKSTLSRHNLEIKEVTKIRAVPRKHKTSGMEEKITPVEGEEGQPPLVLGQELERREQRKDVEGTCQDRANHKANQCVPHRPMLRIPRTYR